MAKIKCAFCGNNPVPHFIFWYNESLNILLTPLRQFVLYNLFSRWAKKSGRTEKFYLRLLKWAEVFKMVSRQTNRDKCKVRRAQVLWEAAEKRGIIMEELLLFGRPFDSYVASESETRDKRQGRRTMVFSGLPRPLGYSNRMLDLMDDKGLFKKIMAANGLPAPAGKCVTQFGQAKKIFSKIQKPVIVKPRVGSRGRHTTTFIFSENDLKKAFKAAKQLCWWVMVEEQLKGPVYRGTVINFKIQGVLRGDPPQITGDGISTVSELVDRKNAFSRDAVKNISKDEQATRFLQAQFLNWQSVPPPGTVVNLSEKIGVNYGGSSSEDFEICHPDNKALFEAAARALGDPIVGFDFIIPDIAKTYKVQRCGFIEVNSLPFINLHHDPLLGAPRDVAGKIWDMLGW